MIKDWRDAPGRYVKDPRLGHRFGRNYPSGEISDAEWNLHWLGTDSQGFIYNFSPQRDFDLADKSFRRVFLLGGSTLMGLGVKENGLTISSVLEKHLRETQEKARTLNCGCGAYTSWHQMLYLCLELIVHKPEVVVVLDGWNDFVHSTWGNKHFSGWIPNTHRSLDDIVTLIQSASGDISFLDLLLRKINKTRFMTELRKRSKYSVEMGAWSDPDYRRWSIKPESFLYYAANIRSTIGISAANQAKIVYLFQPQLLWNTRRATQQEQALIDRISKRMPPMAELAPVWYEEAKLRFASIRAELHNGSSIWIEDLSQIFERQATSEPVYHDYCHYNELGQKLIAQHIRDIILKMWN